MVKKAAKKTKAKEPAWHDGLSRAHRAFCENYVSNGFNGYRAYVDAGYSEKTARQGAHNLLTKIYIKNALAKLLEQVYMTPEELKERIADDARATLEPFLDADINGLAWDFDSAKKAGAFRHLRKVKIKEGEFGKEVSLELVDRQKSQALLANLMGLTRERVEVLDTSSEDDELDFTKLSDDELKELRALMLKAKKDE